MRPLKKKGDASTTVQKKLMQDMAKGQRQKPKKSRLLGLGDSDTDGSGGGVSVLQGAKGTAAAAKQKANADLMKLGDEAAESFRER